MGNIQSMQWYDLFSRGARDWLRHNEKVREAVQSALPDIISGSDVLSDPANRTVRVPVRMMEHFRFRLLDPAPQEGTGQGNKAKPGDTLKHGRPGAQGHGGGGDGEGGVQFVMEISIDEILDWMWKELKLPNLKPRQGTSIIEDELTKEGFDKRGARSRLDRRRTLKEAVKRRGVQGPSALPFVNDDLRFRQLARRRKPTTSAVVIFVLDVSSSMDDTLRRLSKTFFFWALQGIRRQFSHIETVFIAHTMQAWEFEEREFFEVKGEGGTRVSGALHLALEILQTRYSSSTYNSYLFYASDGENFPDDRDQAGDALAKLAEQVNFLGFVKASRRPNAEVTEIDGMFNNLKASGVPSGSYPIATPDDILPAIQKFFTHEANTAEGA